MVILAFVIAACSPAVPLATPPAANVPGIYKTIQSCVDNSSSCIVSAGTYNEVVKVNKSGVTIASAGKAVVKAFLVYGDNNVLRGFTLTDKQSKAGIRTYGDNNLIENNEITDTLEDCIWFWGEGNVFRGNYCHDIFDDRDYPTVDNHVDCWMTWDWIGDWKPATNILFENNRCIHNRAQGSNQGFIVTGTKSSGLTFSGNVTIMSDAGYSPAYALYGGNNIKIENEIMCNSTGKGSPAVWIDGAKNVAIARSTYTGYSSLHNGTAVQSGNIKGALPCLSVPATSVITVTPTNTFTPTLTSTPTKVPPVTPIRICVYPDRVEFCP